MKRQIALIAVITLLSSVGCDGKEESSLDNYVNKYDDLLAAYNANTSGRSKTAWGKQHYCDYGHGEGRTSPGLTLSVCATQTPPLRKNLVVNGSFEQGLDDWKLRGVQDSDFLSYQNNTISNFNATKTKTRPLVKLFLSVPSDGNQFARLVSTAANSTALSQSIIISPSTDYLLLFDGRSEDGLLPPMISVATENPSTLLKHRELTMQIAQTGWTRGGLIFKAEKNEVVITIHNLRRPLVPTTASEHKIPTQFINHYDHIQLYELPKGQYSRQLFLQSYSIEISPTDWVNNRAVNLLHKDFSNYSRPFVRDRALNQSEQVPVIVSQNFDNVFNRLTIPIYDLSVDEHTLWHQGSSGPFYWDYRINGGYKKMIPATLSINQEQYDVRVKPRGVTFKHHLSRNRSFRISFSKKETIHLLAAHTRGYTDEAFSHYLASQLGLITLKNDFIFLRLNGKPLGIYWAFNRNSDDIELSGRPEGYLLEEEQYSYLFDLPEDRWRIYAKPSKKYRKKYRAEKMVSLFYSLLADGDTNAAGILLNKNKFAAWSAHALLLGNQHQDWSHNNLVYLNSADGRLEWVPWDLNWGGYRFHKDLFKRHFNPVLDAFLKKHSFYERRNQVLWQYVQNKDQLLRDLNYFAELLETIRIPLSQSVNYYTRLTKGVLRQIPYQELLEDREAIEAVYRSHFEQKRTLLINSPTPNVRISKVRGSKMPFLYRFEVTADSHHLGTSGPIQKRRHILSSLVLRKITLDRSSNNLLLLDQDLVLLSPQADSTGRRSHGLNALIATDTFFDYNLSLLWRDNYKNILKALEDEEFTKSIFEQCYQDSHIYKYDHYREAQAFAHQLTKECSDDPVMKSYLEDALIKLKDLEGQRSLVFYVSSVKPIDNPKDIITFSFENSVTGASVNPVYPESYRRSISFPSNVALIPEQDGSVTTDTVDLNQSLLPLGKNIPSTIPNVSGIRNTNVPYHYFSDLFLDVDAFVKKHPYFHKVSNRGILLKKGHYVFTANVIIPPQLNLTIEPGAVIKLTEGISIVSYGHIQAIGTMNDPIIFTSFEGQNKWGVIAVVTERASGQFKYCIFNGGNDAYINGAYFSGMLASAYANISIKHSILMNASSSNGDDALNIKGGYAKIANSYFYSNWKDGIDLDFVSDDSVIEHNVFYKNKNDAIDVSGSNITIFSNFIQESGDKGISIGENSKVTIKNNFVTESLMGIAAKDSAQIQVLSSTLVRNKIGIAAYNKKTIFRGATVRVAGTVLQDNGVNFGIEQSSPMGNGRSSICSLHSPQPIQSNKVIREAITEPKKRRQGKLSFLRDYLAGSIDDYDYQFVELRDYCDEISSQQQPPVHIGAERLTRSLPQEISVPFKIGTLGLAQFGDFLDTKMGTL